MTDAVTDALGNIEPGVLLSSTGRRYPIIMGIPRFVDYVPIKSEESFGDEWNYFNFTKFKVNWIAYTFGSTDSFKGKLIVNVGG